MFDDFALRHIPPLLLATAITIGGLMPFYSTPEKALLKFGFPKRVATSQGAWPVITVGSARVSTIGVALWGLYLGGHFAAMDVLLASMGWMAVVDGWVCYQEGASDTAIFRASSTGAVAIWGLLGMTAGR
ncbi:MAG: hypothetical protein M1820_004341 [Bogoriella megaspora]|nr:MAG: hypothetical protein M1820_004341 [Bogoriella megaspora]